MNYRLIIRNIIVWSIFAAGLAWVIADFGRVMEARGDQPPCVGDRHYDDTGSCCPVVTPTPPCPEVKCDCSEPSAPIIVVNRCPDYKYIKKISRCHTGKHGQEVCPNKDFPKRYLKPIYESDNVR